LLTTFVPGHVISTAGWSDVRDTFASTLDTFKQVPPDRAAGIPATRSWCGAESWPAIVQDQLGRHLTASELHVAVHVVTDVLATYDSSDARFVHGDFGLHNMLWSDGLLGGLIDLDHACWSDPAMDLAPLIGTYGARRVAEIASAAEIDRALYHRASLSLQVAAAAELVGDYPLRDHALRIFEHDWRPGRCMTPTEKTRDVVHCQPELDRPPIPKRRMDVLPQFGSGQRSGPAGGRADDAVDVHVFAGIAHQFPIA
jgi:aminoglycoside phosphotransferase (APT) family kinase protein